MIVNPSYTKCPKCEAVYSYTDQISENTPGVEFWSDGFCMDQMRMDVVGFAKCLSCNTFFWVEENSTQKPIDLTVTKKVENFWFIDNISRREIDFIRDAFRSGLAGSHENEIILRTKLWHVINHFLRKYNSQGIFKKLRQKIFESNDYKDAQKLYNASLSLKMNNLIRLANLLKLDKNETANNLLLAEIHRELGDFSKASFFCHKTETSPNADLNRIIQLKQYITSKSKMAYHL